VSVVNILHFNQKPVGQYETNLAGMVIGLSSYLIVSEMFELHPLWPPLLKIYNS